MAEERVNIGIVTWDDEKLLVAECPFFGHEATFDTKMMDDPDYRGDVCEHLTGVSDIDMWFEIEDD